MKKIFLFAFLLCLFLGVLFVIFKSCCYQPQEVTKNRIEQPKDTNFAAIVEHNYRPASIPFLEHPMKPPLRLPQGVDQRDVKRILVVAKTVRNYDSTTHRDNTAVVELKDGTLYVDKRNGEVYSADVYVYQSPVLEFGLFVSIGITASIEKLSPAVSISPIQIYGIIQFPVVIADFYGLGAGAAYRWSNINIGLLLHSSFKTASQVKLVLTYDL